MTAPYAVAAEVAREWSRAEPKHAARNARALALLAGVESVEGGYTVDGAGGLYRVSLERGAYRCDCPAWRHSGAQCKHVVAVALHLEVAARTKALLRETDNQKAENMNAQAILSAIVKIESQLAELRALVGASPSPAPTRATSTAAVAPAEPEVDIDGPRGNPEIRRDPPKWAGESFVGRRYSDATPQYLRELAGFKVWSARKNDEKAAAGDSSAEKYARYDRLDAAMARKWALRIESQSGRPAPAPFEPEDAGDVPF